MSGKLDGDDLSRLFPPTPAPGAMTMDQILDSRTPPRSQASLDREALQYRVLMAASRESILKGKVKDLERAIARAEAGEPQTIEPQTIEPTDWPPYDPGNPINNTDPLHPVDNRAAVAFGMPGRLGTPLQEVSFIANTIPRSAYPVNTVQVYLGMSRPLTQMECDFLNGDTP